MTHAASRQVAEEADRSRPAAGCDQCRGSAGEIHPPRASQHAAPMVGAAATGGGTGGHFRPAGQRPWKSSEQPADFATARTRRKLASERKRLFTNHRRPCAVGEHHQRGSLERARAEIRTLVARGLRAEQGPPAGRSSYSIQTSCPPSTIHLRAAARFRLEAQRLGLEAYASDLNPVAVLINKAMIEIPPRFAGRAPVGPVSRTKATTAPGSAESMAWCNGLAEDVRYYGSWMRDEAQKRIGHSIRRSRSPRRWRRNGPTSSRSSARSSPSSPGSGRAR